eukprot:CAMPEP_0184681086 /NCGR_PEP_ID=MMETSP0312-20130426/4049_1 /TAXON_ID=31354 /ORGANISM="Compsopogon coeruleus, Strain SAG 36.94" /LENGTH=64 /DNA_ID=CAMNT_0027131691 /DNA_START=514 /DNA_END=708 /DNA_ORIENTATION=-
MLASQSNVYDAVEEELVILEFVHTKERILGTEIRWDFEEIQKPSKTRGWSAMTKKYNGEKWSFP